MKQYLIVMVVALLILSGCSGDATQNDLINPFIGGTAFITMTMGGAMA